MLTMINVDGDGTCKQALKSFIAKLKGFKASRCLVMKRKATLTANVNANAILEPYIGKRELHCHYF